MKVAVVGLHRPSELQQQFLFLACTLHVTISMTITVKLNPACQHATGLECSFK